METNILILLLIVILAFFAFSRIVVERIEHNHYGQRVDFFHRYPVNEGDVVFLGDSITDGGCWEELFPGVPLKNRGINADTSTGVLLRIEDILRSRPKAIFLLIGTNDLPWFEYRSDKAILRTYSQILDKCHEESPRTRILVQSLLPRARGYRQRIERLNGQLKQLAEIYGHTYIDLHSSFVDSKGGLRDELTNDHLHLLAGGYARWVEILTPYINELFSTDN